MPENPNPQGKGGNTVLAVLTEQRAATLAVPPKHVEQVSTELFTSLFVLESEFRFQPVPGKTYYLYEKEDGFWLALTPPSIISEAVAGRFIGTCHLQPDLTWTLELAEAVAADDKFMAFLAAKRDAFETRLADADSLDQALPVYQQRFSFYRQAAAFGLSQSLGRSMEQTGIRHLDYDDARGLIGSDSAPSSGDSNTVDPPSDQE